MLARPFMSPAGLLQPALGKDAPVPPLLVVGAPATPEAPPLVGELPARPPEPPAVLACIPPALTCPPAAGDMPPAAGLPPGSSLAAPAESVDPPLLVVDPLVPPCPAGLVLTELEHAIAQGQSTTLRMHARQVRE